MGADDQPAGIQRPPLDSFMSGYCALQGMAGDSSVTPASGNHAAAFVDAKLMPSLIGERLNIEILRKPVPLRFSGAHDRSIKPLLRA
jgi:hypothetical protein